MRCERRRQIEQLSLPVLVAPHGSLLPPPVSLRQHPAWGAFSSCAVLVQACGYLARFAACLHPLRTDLAEVRVLCLAFTLTLVPST